MRPLLRSLWPPILVLTVVLGGWQLYVTAAGVDPTTLPSPARVVEQGWLNRQDLWDQTLPTLQETLLGFALSFAAAWLVAVLLDFSSGPAGACTRCSSPRRPSRSSPWHRC